MQLLVDAHCDLAWNMLNFGRDYTRSAIETRAREKDTLTVERNGDTLVGWPEYQRGNVAIVFSTLFAAPARSAVGSWDKLCYASYDEAHRLYRDQLNLYHQLVETESSRFRLILGRAELREHMSQWQDPALDERPVGLLVLMEGADGIRSPEELAAWYEGGVRVIGLAWSGTRYAGGTRQPGPLTAEGRLLLRAMAELGFVLDLSHMDEQSASEALEIYEGPVIATHVNCLALLPDFPTNRHFSDRLMRGIIERGGVIGSVPLNSFLKSGWNRKNGSRREEVPLEVFVGHLDRICQLAGDSLHAGLGSDFDGGFGVQSVPPEIDTIADLQKVVPLLEARGYTQTDTANILGSNWLRCLETSLAS